MPSPVSAPSRPELEALLVKLFGEVAALKQTVAEQREEIAHLKGLKGRPDIKPSGTDKDTAPAKSVPEEAKRRGRGKITPRVKVEEKVIGIEVPPGSVFKGHEAYTSRRIPMTDRLPPAMAAAGPPSTPSTIAAGESRGCRPAPA